MVLEDNIENKKDITLIVKPTHDCNLACSYCYIDDNAEKGIMNNATLENTILKPINYLKKNSSVSFIWHGGEPLLVGLDFYKDIISIQKNFKKEYNIRNSIQSNGTLLTNELANFFQDNNFTIGFSLDGTKNINNKTRLYYNGLSSFDEALSGIKLAKDKNICGGVISIITKHNIDNLVEAYSFFKENSINIKFNPLIFSGSAINKYSELALSPSKYGLEMKKLFDIWFNEVEYKISVNPFDSILGNIITMIPFGCNYSESCQDNFLSIGPLGDVYPCGRFDGIEEFHLGNINTNSMQEINNSPMRLYLKSRKNQKIIDCQPCDYKKICNSGCPHDAYMSSNNIMNKTHYCADYKILFEHITSALKKELNI